MENFWVFGYGSLMWRPGFDYLNRHIGKLYGYHRALCVYSHVHRGTPEKPGLVVGLDRGGSCYGIAFEIDGRYYDQVMLYLREREQVTSVYLETHHKILLDDGRTIPAVAYTIDRTHPQYAGVLSDEKRFELVKHGEGQSGKNPEYILSTYEHLQELGLNDRPLARLVKRLQSDQPFD
jgi:glutathione-specific gamma-glutamylcyclotransferase